MSFLLPILRLPKVTRNIISVQYATQSKSFLGEYIFLSNNLCII